MRNETRDWNKIIQEQRESGMPVSHYCREHKISASQFYKYKKIIETQNSQNTDTVFTPVVIEKETIAFSIDGHRITCEKKDVRLLMEVLL